MSAGYDDKTWRALSRRVRLEEPVCWKPGCGRRSTSTDHIQTKLDRPDLFLVRENCRGSCSKHNMGLVMPKLAAMARINRNPQPRRAW